MNVAIVVAGGKGTRLGRNRPKQFLELDRIPVIIRTLRQFERCREIDEIIIVLPASQTEEPADWFRSAAKKFGLQKPMQMVGGGSTRAQSVQRGLAIISGAELFAVHDAVRPFVTPDEIDRVVAAARTNAPAMR